MTTAAEIEKIKGLVRSGIIDADISFLDTGSRELGTICNGCGAANAKFDFVPDTIYGLDISAACTIHDWDYFSGKKIRGKGVADRRFLNNLLRLIAGDKSFRRFIKPLMRRRALKYFEAVTAFGGPAFWAGKNEYS